MNKMLGKEVSLELADLLKKNGFDETCNKGWYYVHPDIASKHHIEINTWQLLPIHPLLNQIKAPTVGEVVDWIYEKHGIWIYVDSHEFNKWCYNYKYNRPHKLNPRVTENGQFGLDDYNSPTEAYEEGIKYVLNNLI